MESGMLHDLATSFADPNLARDGLRMLLALALGAVIGFEREWHEKAAGMRTHMLVSLGACLAALISLDLMGGAGGDPTIRIDPLRLVQGIATAVGFLAAGTIIVTNHRVKGLTTGTGLWLAGMTGLAAGLGHAALATLATILAVIVLWLLRLLEPKKK